MGVAPAIEVGRESSVPVSQVYDVLRTLESKGYVETIERAKLYVRPRDPSRLALSDFGSYKNVTLDTGDDTVVVGGWGAVYEDVEMRTIPLVDIDIEEPPNAQ